MRKFPIVCISGSMKFYDEMLKLAVQLTNDEYIVLMPFANKKDIASKDNFERQSKEAILDEMHLRKIDMCQSLAVVAIDGYIGNSTRKEIEYAASKGLEINIYGKR